MSAGYVTFSDIFNNAIDFSYMPRGCKTPKLSNCKRVSARRSVLCERLTNNTETVTANIS